MVWSSDISDSEIVQLIRDDPQQGFTVLLQQYGGRIRGYLRQRFPSLDENDLQDAATDAMLALADSFDPQRGALPAWFLLLAHQNAVSMLRRASKSLDTVETTPDVVAIEDDPLTILQTRERLSEVERTIETFPALERAVLEADLAGDPTQDARVLAERLGTSRESIYSARRRARARLKQQCDWVRDYLRGGKDEDGKS